MGDAYDRLCRWKPRVYEDTTPGSELIGARFRNGRVHAGLSQRRLAALSGVSQSLISRLERGRCPGLAAKRIIAIAVAIGPAFPLGCCPHDHDCSWPADPYAKQNYWRILND